MVPTDYRLDHVVARLIERLEAQRPTFADRPDEGRAAFERTARAHVEAAVAEMRATGWADAPDAHAAFLEREVMDTFLPRYHAVAMRMNEVEAGGYGFGRLAEPLGRLGLFAGVLLFGWVVLLKLITLPVIWPLVVLTAAVPFAPDIARVLYRRRHLAELTEIVDDMTRIQEQHDAYLPPEVLASAEEPPRPRPRQGITE